MIAESKMRAGLFVFGPWSRYGKLEDQSFRFADRVAGFSRQFYVLVRSPLAIIAAVMLSACVPTLEAPVFPSAQTSIRPGATSAIDQNGLTPPSGVRYEYSVQGDDNPVFPEASIQSFVSRKVSSNKYVYEGNIFMPISFDLESDEEFLAILRGFAGDETGKIVGNKFVSTIVLETDRRSRIIRVDTSFVGVTFLPHDCFAQLGTCRSTMRTIVGDTLLLTETSEAGGIWRSVTRATSGALKGMRSESVYSIDSNGVLLDSETRQMSPDGTVATRIMRRLEPKPEP